MQPGRPQVHRDIFPVSDTRTTGDKDVNVRSLSVSDTLSWNKWHASTLADIDNLPPSTPLPAPPQQQHNTHKLLSFQEAVAPYLPLNISAGGIVAPGCATGIGSSVACTRNNLCAVQGF